MRLVRNVGIAPLHGECQHFIEAIPTPNENTCNNLATTTMHSVTLYDELTLRVEIGSERLA